MKIKNPTKTQKSLINLINSRGGVVYIEQSADMKPVYYLDNNTGLSTDRIERLIRAGWLVPHRDGMFHGTWQSLMTTIKEIYADTK